MSRDIVRYDITTSTMLMKGQFLYVNLTNDHRQDAVISIGSGVIGLKVDPDIVRSFRL